MDVSKELDDKSEHAKKSIEETHPLESIEKKVEKIGLFLTQFFHLLALFIIGATIVWSAVVVYLDMMKQGHASLHDILLLFIYLELGAMISIYFVTRKLPVEFLIYISITALTRVLTIDIKKMENETVITIVGATLLLTLSILVLNIARKKFGTSENNQHY